MAYDRFRGSGRMVGFRLSKNQSGRSPLPQANLAI